MKNILTLSAIACSMLITNNSYGMLASSSTTLEKICFIMPDAETLHQMLGTYPLSDFVHETTLVKDLAARTLNMNEFFIAYDESLFFYGKKIYQREGAIREDEHGCPIRYDIDHNKLIKHMSFTEQALNTIISKILEPYPNAKKIFDAFLKAMQESS